MAELTDKIKRGIQNLVTYQMAYGLLLVDEAVSAYDEICNAVQKGHLEDMDIAGFNQMADADLSEYFHGPDVIGILYPNTRKFFHDIDELVAVTAGLDNAIFYRKDGLDNCQLLEVSAKTPTFDTTCFEEIGFVKIGDYVFTRTIQSYEYHGSIVNNCVLVFPSNYTNDYTNTTFRFNETSVPTYYRKSLGDHGVLLRCETTLLPKGAFSVEEYPELDELNILAATAYYTPADNDGANFNRIVVIPTEIYGD